MKKIIYAVLMGCIVLLAGCGKSSIEGEYKSLGGKVGVYEMQSLLIQSSADGSKYNVKFVGSERSLSYENVEFQNDELKISDKGFLMPVKITGNKASVEVGGATFEKLAK